jgi:hypothetical protein
MEVHLTNIENREAGGDFSTFLSNLSLLMENRERIVNDSRMFLTPTHVPNSVYGCPSFKNVTVGMYLEWWQDYAEYSHDNDGNLIYLIAGSSILGVSNCRSIDADGNTQPSYIRDFYAVFRSLLKVTGKYRDVVNRSQAYTLDELVAILSGTADATDIINKKNAETVIAQAQKIVQLEQELANKAAELRALREANIHAQLMPHITELSDAVTEHNLLENEVVQLNIQINRIRHKISCRRKHGIYAGELDQELAALTARQQATADKMYSIFPNIIKKKLPYNPNSIDEKTITDLCLNSH